MKKFLLFIFSLLFMGCNQTIDYNSMNDEELYDALYTKILITDMKDKDVLEYYNELNGTKRVFYVISYMDMEIQNGGICQFFENSSGDLSDYVIENLEIIGANEYAELYSQFISANDLSQIDSDEDYETLDKIYHFDDFDNQYYELYEKNPLDQILISYMRNHLDEL